MEILVAYHYRHRIANIVDDILNIEMHQILQRVRLYYIGN
jgi:hypothetical protein